MDTTERKENQAKQATNEDLPDKYMIFQQVWSIVMPVPNLDILNMYNIISVHGISIIVILASV